MKRTEKKKLVLTKIDVRTAALTPKQLQQVVGATGNHPCCGFGSFIQK
jgi:hypothetical protein